MKRVAMFLAAVMLTVGAGLALSGNFEDQFTRTKILPNIRDYATASLPTPGIEGRMAFDTTVDTLVVDNGSDWETVTHSPDANLAESQYWLPGTAYPAGGAAAEDALANDLEVVCYRAYLPYAMTVTEAVVYEFQVATAGASDYIGVAIYEDADAGAQLTEGASVFATDGGALVIDVTDVTLNPDWYRFCASQNDVSAQDWLGYPQATGEAAVMNETVSELLFGLATNASTGNADMPATTGALASSAESIPLVKFQTN